MPLSRSGHTADTTNASASSAISENSSPLPRWPLWAETTRKQITARNPKTARGGAPLGRRDQKDAKPLISIEELAPGLRADEIIGSEVRSSDDKIIGEVRNIVFGMKDRRDYAIVASGGFFTPGKESIVVPIRSLKVSQERASFFLPITQAQAKAVP